jgi:hypothetical protein
MDDNRGRQLLHVTGEASLVGERVEQQAEAQTRRTSLVGQELELIAEKRPMLSQLILRPPSPHRESPSVSTEWTRTVPSNVLTRALSSGWVLVLKSAENDQCRYLSTSTSNSCRGR